MAIKEEISHLELNLKELEKPIDYFWRTAKYLCERQLAARKRLELLQTKRKVQEKLRAKHARGATPPELMNRILSYVPTFNKLEWDSEEIVYVEGLTPLIIHNPPLLSFYTRNPYETSWRLEEIARQGVKLAVLEEVSLRKHLKLRARTSNISDLRPLMKYPHKWMELEIDHGRLAMEEFIGAVESRLPYLEELRVTARYVTISGVIPAVQSSQLKTVSLTFDFFSVFYMYNSGGLKSITNLCNDPYILVSLIVM